VFYREAQRRFGVRWQLVAAINFVESDFGRARTTASGRPPDAVRARDLAPVRLGGDVNDAHDAILAAASLRRERRPHE
jgi:hypothetical protein